GATDTEVALAGKPASTQLVVSEPTGPASASLRAAPERRAYLNIENITGSGAPRSYAVYVNLPQGANPAGHQDRYAGLLPMFGVAEASRADDNHAASGLHYTLEVSDLVRRLEAQADWQP